MYKILYIFTHWSIHNVCMLVNNDYLWLCKKGNLHLIEIFPV